MQPAPDFVPSAGFVDVRGDADMSEAAGDAGNTMVSASLRLYKPAVTAAWRLRMMRTGNLPDAELARIRRVPGLGLLQLQAGAWASSLAQTHAMASGPVALQGLLDMAVLRST